MRDIDPRDCENGLADTEQDVKDGVYDTVTIPRAEYDSLKEDAETLRRLENAGVDNWQWYSEVLNHPEGYE